jgi:hypothetical protein
VLVQIPQVNVHHGVAAGFVVEEVHAQVAVHPAPNLRNPATMLSDAFSKAVARGCGDGVPPQLN